MNRTSLSRGLILLVTLGPWLWACSPASDKGGGNTKCEGPDCASAELLDHCTNEQVLDYGLSEKESVLLFAADFSNSLNEPLAADPMGRTRGQALKAALASVLPKLNAQNEMGFLRFPSAAGGNGCGVADSPEVPIQANHASELAGQVQNMSAMVNGNTPLYFAAFKARRALNEHMSDKPKYIVLATDGQPANCGGSFEEVVQELNTARSQNISTFVLGFAGDPSLHGNLNRLAEAGGKALSGDLKFYDVNSSESFESALRSIAASAADCRYPLKECLGNAPGIRVWLDDTEVREGDQGWKWSDENKCEIRFQGQACESLLSGSVQSAKLRYQNPACSTII